MNLTTVYKDVGSAEGWIIIIQWGIWLIQVLWRTWKALRGNGINREHHDPEGFKAEAAALAELMGPGPDRSPERKKSKRKQQMGYTKGREMSLMGVNMFTNCEIFRG